MIGYASPEWNWLRGYSACAWFITDLRKGYPKEQERLMARAGVRRWLMDPNKLDQYTNGWIDALLDSLDC